MKNDVEKENASKQMFNEKFPQSLLLKYFNIENKSPRMTPKCDKSSSPNVDIQISRKANSELSHSNGILSVPLLHRKRSWIAMNE